MPHTYDGEAVVVKTEPDESGYVLPQMKARRWKPTLNGALSRLTPTELIALGLVRGARNELRGIGQALVENPPVNVLVLGGAAALAIYLYMEAQKTR
jgi:hypothetical protein